MPTPSPIADSAMTARTKRMPATHAYRSHALCEVRVAVTARSFLMPLALASAKWEAEKQVALSPFDGTAVWVGHFAAPAAKNGQGFHAARARPLFGGLSVPGGVSNEHRGTSNSEASAAVVRAQRRARSSSSVPTQWRSLPGVHVA